MSMRRSHQITSGMSLLLGYDTGPAIQVPGTFLLLRQWLPYCRVSGVPAGRECSGKLRRSAILAVRRTLTGNRGEYLRVVGIHSDG